MQVLWTVQARRNLRHALAWELGRGEGSSVEDRRMAMLNKILTKAFRRGKAVVVKDQVVGYRAKEEQFTLLIEVFGARDEADNGPMVVKIGLEDQIVKEIEGWTQCRPTMMKHDLVLLGLEHRQTYKIGKETWMCIVYADGNHSLSVPVVESFEEAAIDCTRSGSPRLSSIVEVINALYERIGHLLYRTSYPVDPKPPPNEPKPSDYVLELPHLDTCLNRWQTDQHLIAARKEVNSLVKSGSQLFFDPIDYLEYVRCYVACLYKPPEKGQPIVTREPTIKPEDRPPSLPDLPTPAITNLVPRMLRGFAHGDLHGRNILVGIVEHKAMWPTVFDYEDMGRDKMIGWDFVKLETELKIRAYYHVFDGSDRGRFVESVQGFEIQLNKRTEDCHLSRQWPDPGDPKSPAERLTMILLAIRRMASQHLGSNKGRPNDWLEEYYFLLACYGTCTAKFDNLQAQERIGVLIASGVAVSRLSWPRHVYR